MSKILWKILYYFLISPLIIFVAHIAGIFSKTIRNGLIPRYKVFQQIRAIKNNGKEFNPAIIFHANVWMVVGRTVEEAQEELDKEVAKLNARLKKEGCPYGIKC